MAIIHTGTGKNSSGVSAPAEVRESGAGAD